MVDGDCANGTCALGRCDGNPTCANGKKDTGETGIDCGGSCPACPNYKIAAPNKNNNATSGCSGAG